jgi:hypothetical protein
MEIFRLHLGLIIKINIVILGNIILFPNAYSHKRPIKDYKPALSSEQLVFDPPLIRQLPDIVMAKEVRSISIIYSTEN